MSTPVVRSIAALRVTVRNFRQAGDKIGLIPTMGALHDGHLALVAAAKARGCKAVATVFVNPKQFSPSEDLATYPRDEAGDLAKLTAAGTDLLFAPMTGEVYPAGFSTSVDVAGVSDHLCGATRPHFFGGVATVVTKLLLQALPDMAFFGEKDFQQLQVIRRLVRDLDVPVEIVGAPTVREQDGLARSSRNAYLSHNERPVAGRLNLILAEAAAALADGAGVARTEAEAVQALLAAGFDKVDYVEIRGAEDLRRLGPGPVDGPARVLAAAWLGRTRLIDNMAV